MTTLTRIDIDYDKLESNIAKLKAYIKLVPEQDLPQAMCALCGSLAIQASSKAMDVAIEVAQESMETDVQKWLRGVVVPEPDDEPDAEERREAGPRMPGNPDDSNGI